MHEGIDVEENKQPTNAELLAVIQSTAASQERRDTDMLARLVRVEDRTKSQSEEMVSLGTRLSKVEGDVPGARQESQEARQEARKAMASYEQLDQFVRTTWKTELEAAAERQAEKTDAVQDLAATAVRMLHEQNAMLEDRDRKREDQKRADSVAAAALERENATKAATDERKARSRSVWLPASIAGGASVIVAALAVVGTWIVHRDSQQQLEEDLERRLKSTVAAPAPEVVAPPPPAPEVPDADVVTASPKRRKP